MGRGGDDESVNQMNEPNGKNGYWVRWLVGTLFTILFLAFTTLCNYVIANDEKSVKDRQDIRKELNACVIEQMRTNQQILVTLARIEAEIKR